MGKISYDPKASNKENNEGTLSDGIRKIPENRIDGLIDNLNSVRPIGDVDCDYAVYLEDYVYTYLYQYAQTDLSCEHSAAIFGEYYPETKEMIVCGAIPIPKHMLNQADEWVNQAALESLYDEKEKYFPGTSLLGWLHMQPGYGTMLTMKEVKVHRELFSKEGSLLLLIDPINKIETFHIYEDDMLKEQSGYYIYYDKNPSMQQYMLDKPLVEMEKEEIDDSAVTQFREIGQRRKREYQQRKKTNFTVIAASVLLLGMAAVMLQVDETKQGNRNDVVDQSVQNAQVAENQSSTPQFTFVDPTNMDEVDTLEGDDVDQEVSLDDTVDVTEDTTDAENTDVADSNDSDEDVSEVYNETNETEVDDVENEIETEEVETEEVDSEEEAEDASVETEVESTEKYTTYVVESGDTLRRISEKHFETESRAKDISSLNGIENGDHIFVGQTLKIPAN
ncbi:MAG: LysM peptidoglycan-binding domain-containing protein [Cellulosilyticaceae bacterium]